MSSPGSGTCEALTTADRRLLKDLAMRKADIAAMPIQEERRALWSKLNGLHSVRPMVCIFEIPWNEMDTIDSSGEGELSLRCTHALGRDVERMLRRELYRWDHMPGDMVVEQVVEVDPVLLDTDFELEEEVDIRRIDATSSVVSRHFHVQIASEADIEKIRMPRVCLDAEAWKRLSAMLAATSFFPTSPTRPCWPGPTGTPRFVREQAGAAKENT